MSKPITVLTAAEWADRIREAARVADQLFTELMHQTAGPGQGVLVAMLLARTICEANPALPDFAWYCARVSELPGKGKN